MRGNFSRTGTTLAVCIFICFATALCTILVNDAIALKNIGLATGVLFSLVVILFLGQQMPLTKFFNPANIALFCIVAWVICNYLFLSSTHERGLSEIKGVWFRALLAILLGTAVGLMCGQYKKLMAATLVFITLAPLSIYYLGFLSATEYTRIPFDGFFKSKAAVSYFLLFPILASFGYVQSILFRKNLLSRQSIFFIALGVTTICLSLYGFYFSKSLNGILVAACCGLIFICSILIKSIRLKQRKEGLVLFSAICIIGITGSLIAHSKQDSKLDNIFQDAYLGMQIDRHSNWQNSSNKPWIPTAEDGHLVSQSTYFRVANILNGMRFIQENPLGVGFIHLPYGYLMKQRYPDSQVTHSHSGWVDFTVGQGIPALILLLLAIMTTFKLGLQSTQEHPKNNLGGQVWGYVTMYTMTGVFIGWIVNEVSEREYIEHLCLIISLFAAGNIPYKQSISS